MPNLARRKKTTDLTYVGIDPGSSSGGLAAILPNGVLTLPMGNLTERELWEWFKPFRPSHTVAVVEHVQAFAKQQAKSMFSFGRNYGQVRMSLIAAGIPFDEVRPQVWQSAMGIPPKGKKTGTQHKELMRAKCQQLYPDLGVWDRTLGEQRAVADALLIATYSQRLYSGALRRTG